MTVMEAVTRTVLVGIGATAVMDVWLLLLKRIGVPVSSFGLIGRWVGHLFRGRFTHAAIGKAPAVEGELALGWATHYAVGIMFAGLLVGVYGLAWLQEPSVMPAVIVGTATVVAPLFMMQPAMGAGFAASKTPTPFRNCMRSILNHVVFGLGLYVAAIVIDSISR